MYFKCFILHREYLCFYSRVISTFSAWSFINFGLSSIVWTPDKAVKGVQLPLHRLGTQAIPSRCIQLPNHLKFPLTHLEADGSKTFPAGAKNLYSSLSSGMANKTSVHVQSKGKPFEAVMITTLLSLMKSKKTYQVSEPDQLDCIGVGFSDLI